MVESNEISVERWASGRPHKGKVFAAIFPHSDDFTLFAAGTMAKMLSEGYEGYFIRTTNDEKDSFDLSIGETIFRIERETRDAAALLGIRKVYDFNYKNHYLDEGQATEIRHRLIALLRFLKADTVLSFDPWGHYEENPDHYLTGKCVEAACWMAGRALDLPETVDMGILPHTVAEKYYIARGPQLVNRIVDISPALYIKRRAIACNKTPIDNMWKTYLQKTGGAGEMQSVEAFIEQKWMREQEPLCGLKYYEKFHYIGPAALK